MFKIEIEKREIDGMYLLKICHNIEIRSPQWDTIPIAFEEMPAISEMLFALFISSELELKHETSLENKQNGKV